jgi:hypothetical protein
MSVATITDRFAAGFLITFATLLAGTAVAQSGRGYSTRQVATGDGMEGSYSGESGYGGNNGSSTAAESFLRGRAAVIEELGKYELHNSQAGILREQARALDRENSLKQTEALLAQKKMWSDARIQERKDHEARSAEGRKLLAERRATIYRQAYQLLASELNLKTGAICWPNALQDDKFQEKRARLEELFRQHVGYEAPQVNMAQEIARSVDQWARALRNEVGSMPPEDFRAAQKFLLGLKYGATRLVEST